MQKVRGYIFSSDFCGEKIPQNVQNLYIRNYFKNNNLHYMLSSVEYSIHNSVYILDGLFDEINNVNGVVFYSFYQLPKNSLKRKEFFIEMVNFKKKIFFCSENITINKIEDFEKIETLWQLKQVVISNKSIWYN